MAKLFVVSDIHSFYTIFINALNKAGYDENNPDHWLIVCGDCFDRGDESQEVLNFLQGRDRCVLIKGNHEDLILECIERGFFERHDITNGTVKTIMSLGNQIDNYCGRYIEGGQEVYNSACDITYSKIKPFIDGMVNYFETKKYIFVHSWIPCDYVITQDALDKWGQMAYANPPRKYSPDWRTAWNDSWAEARWDNPFSMAMRKLNKTGKTIVFGHWHTSWYYNKTQGTPEFGEGAIFDIARDKSTKIIGIDACTAASEQCNVLVLEDDFIEETDKIKFFRGAK